MRGQRKAPARRAALAAVAVLALTGVAACGPGGSDAKGSSDREGDARTSEHSSKTADASPVAALRLADESAAEARSARVESTMTLGSQMSAKSTGAIAWGDGLSGVLTVTYTGGSMADTMRKAGMTSTEVRYLPDAFYTDLGEKAAGETGGKRWLRYGYDDLTKAAGASGAYGKDQLQNASPTASVKLLLASGDVHKVGPEKVRGQDAVHYSGTIRPADFAAKSSHLTEDQLSELEQQLQKAGITTEKVDIWVDADGLPVKSATKAHTANGDTTQTLYYSDYGVKVTAKKPPADQTVDIKDLLKSRQKQ